MSKILTEKYSPHLRLAHLYWKNHLHISDTVIDATCGNGKDTLVLSQLVPEGFVFGIDIQPDALKNTCSLLGLSLSTEQLARVVLHLGCHGDFKQLTLPTAPRLIVYNLGYLPGGDKLKSTRATTTLQSIKEASLLLAQGGAISITCYPARPEGNEELISIMEWTKTLDANTWQVYYHQWMTRKNTPTLFWIIRACSESKGP